MLITICFIGTSLQGLNSGAGPFLADTLSAGDAGFEGIQAILLRQSALYASLLKFL
jgi:hypothetical protein